MADATSASYTPVEADATMYLRATAMYTDAHGSGKSEMAVTANMVLDAAATGDSLLETYDADDSGMIEKSEVITAINDYLFEKTISRADMIEVINLYLFG